MRRSEKPKVFHPPSPGLWRASVPKKRKAFQVGADGKRPQIRGSVWAFDYKPANPDGNKLNVVTPTEEGYWAAVIKVRA